MINSVKMCAFKDVSNVLGDVEASEESSDILVRRLPRQSSGSDHRVVAHFLHFTAAHTHRYYYSGLSGNKNNVYL